MTDLRQLLIAANPFYPETKYGEVYNSEIKSESKIEITITEKLDVKIKIECCGLLPRNGGEWSGEPGNSDWKADPNVEPGDRHGTNPEHKTWEQIMDEYDFHSIQRRYNANVVRLCLGY